MSWFIVPFLFSLVSAGSNPGYNYGFDQKWYDNGTCGDMETFRIDAWCSGDTGGGFSIKEACCGLCSYTSISGQGQLAWSIGSTLLIMSSVILDLGVGSKLAALQLLVCNGYMISTFIKITAYPGSLALWHVAFVFPQFLAHLPIMTAVILSPGWDSLLSLNTDKLNKLEEKHPHGKDGFLSRLHRRMKVVHDAAGSAKSIKSFKRWTKFVAIGWTINWIWWFLLFMIFLVWSDWSKYSQANCNDQLGINISVRVCIFVTFFFFGGSCVLVLMMYGMSATGMSGSDILLCFLNRKYTNTTQFNKGVFGSLFEDTRTKTQVICAWTIYFVWLIPNVTIFANANKSFLLYGDDPWTYGQIEQVYFVAPDTFGLFLTIVARSDKLSRLRLKDSENHNDLEASEGSRRRRTSRRPSKSRIQSH